MGLAQENCPKCDHTLEDTGNSLECLNSNCDLTTMEELREYYQNQDMTFNDIRR